MRSAKIRGCFTLFLLLLLHNEGSAQTENNKNENKEEIQYRLPRGTIPISYDVKLWLDRAFEDFTFDGETRINIAINETTRNLTLHSKDLRIDEHFTSLIGTNGAVHRVIRHTYDDVTNFLVIQFDELLATGNYTLALKYNGSTAILPEGIFRSSYTNEKGEIVSLVATKFTQLHARRAFPCWDEPDLKATFNLSLRHESNYTAVSNMPMRGQIVDDDGKQWTNFRSTPRMSTYLLAFIVSDFHCLRENDETFGVCGRKDVLPYLKHSRDVGQRAFGLLNQYFDYKYNLPKIDQFAVPDATTGGTENWGLIIYRESSFAYEPFVHPISGKEYVTFIVVHELAHQWIGNLVTPKTWQYSWIKEGLTTFLQYVIVDKLFPDWREMDMFVTQIIQDRAFDLDDSDYYKPLEWNSDNPADIRSKFSAQIYNRGAAIFYMMSNILNETTFKSGIVKFVKDNAFGSFTSDDLWNAMQSTYDELTTNESISHSKEKSYIRLPIKTIMKPWIDQQGFPLINVTRDYETGKVVITQEGNLEGQKSNRWWIPINFATSSNPNFENTSPSHWLKPCDESLVIDGISKDDWIIVNIQQSGYYRVNYDTTNWKRIAKYMNSDKYKNIHVRNRAQLINDLSYMIELKRENYTTLLDVMSYLVREDDYQPWLPTFRAIKAFRRTMYNEEVDRALKKFILGLMEKVIDKIGFEDRSKYDWMKKYKANYDNLDAKTKKFVPTEKAIEKFYKSEDFLTRRFRSKFLSFACSLDHKECLLSAKAQLRANIKNPTEHPISPDLVSWVNCHGAEGSEEELMKNVNGSDIKYLVYLGCSPNKTILRKYADKVLSGELNATRKQTTIAIGYLSGDPKNFESGLDYFIDNIDTIHELLEKEPQGEKSSSSTMTTTTRMPMILTGLIDYIPRIRTLDQMKKMNDLVARKKELMPSWVGEMIKNQTARIEWSEEYAPILGEWLHDHSTQISGNAK